LKALIGSRSGFSVLKKVAGGSHGEKPATAANPYFRWPADLLVG